MAHARMHRIFGVAAAGAIALAYLQVAEAPAVPASSTPSVEQIIEYVKADVQWIRTEIPRSGEYWKVVTTRSSSDFRVLVDALSNGGQPPR